MTLKIAESRFPNFCIFIFHQKVRYKPINACHFKRLKIIVEIPFDGNFSKNPDIKTPLLVSFWQRVVIQLSPQAAIWCQGSQKDSHYRPLSELSIPSSNVIEIGNSYKLSAITITRNHNSERGLYIEILYFTILFLKFTSLRSVWYTGAQYYWVLIGLKTFKFKVK